MIASRYAQLLILAKWILDPAEPINYAQHAKAKLPSPLTAPLGPAAHGSTELWGALGKCDPKVPNATTIVNGVPLPYGDLLYGLAGIPSTLYESSTAERVPPARLLRGHVLDTLDALDALDRRQGARGSGGVPPEPHRPADHVTLP